MDIISIICHLYPNRLAMDLPTFFKTLDSISEDLLNYCGYSLNFEGLIAFFVVTRSTMVGG